MRKNQGEEMAASNAFYGALNAKIGALRGKLLDYNDYYMLSRSKSVRDATVALREYPAYSGHAINIENGENLRRNPVEPSLAATITGDFSRIYSFVSDTGARAFLDAYYLKIEIIVLKHILSTIYDNRNIPYSHAELARIFTKRAKLDIQRLFEAKTPGEFIESLRGTEFELRSITTDQNTSSLFFLAAELGLRYYLHIKRMRTKGQHKPNIQAFNYIFGVETDLRNAMWVYRLKRWYDVPPSLIYAYLVPSYYKLKKDDLTKLVETTNLQSLDAVLAETPYGVAFEDKTRLENGYYSEMRKVYKRAGNLFPNSIASAAAYLHFKEIELKNITALIEGVRYNLSPDDILKHILFTDKTEGRRNS